MLKTEKPRSLALCLANIEERRFSDAGLTADNKRGSTLVDPFDQVIDQRNVLRATLQTGGRKGSTNPPFPRRDRLFRPSGHRTTVGETAPFRTRPRLNVTMYREPEESHIRDGCFRRVSPAAAGFGPSD
ncbi:hypothetical protein ACVWXQ_003522 [Bradyrhizobium sp. S3.14.4]